MWEVLETIGRVSVASSKAIVAVLGKCSDISDEETAALAQRMLVSGEVVQDTKDGRELAWACATGTHVRLAKAWPGGPQAFYEHRESSRQVMLSGLTNGAPVATIDAAFQSWFRAVANR